MPITLTLDGPVEVLGSLVPLFARAHGWAQGGTQTATEYARDVLGRFLRESVTAVLVADAQAAAATAAREQAAAAAGAVTMALS